ncbi:MAG TPA: hypothetical protein PKD20_01165 [Candidatus Saccharibacteria bacterium]|nr:hypothetical protein [Candidatus Saccharibacteria bacterium]HMT55466.1 hypothetical protein [Candidatus Saccharibacteria bacterium]
MSSRKADYRVIEWQEVMNGVGISCALDIAIHPSNSKIIMLTIPGVDGSVDGFDNKYLHIAETVQEKYGVAVVRISNPFISSYHWESNIRQAIDYIQMNAQEICGNETFELRIMAHSAGAAVIGRIAHEYAEITRVLLINPALKLKPNDIHDGLAKLSGRQVTVLVGSKDSSSDDIAEVVDNHTDLYVVDGADHHFSGDNFQLFLDSPNKYLFS